MKEPYEITFRHRADPNESVASRHATLIKALNEFPPPWGYHPNQAPGVTVNTAELVSVLQLKELSSRGLRSYISYPLRSRDYLRDDAQFDDVLVIEFKPAEADLSYFVETVLPRYIEAFDCYRATVANRAVAREDWSTIVEQVNATGKDVNGRDGVYRINEINFFDRELCRRSFGLKPEQITERLQGQVERVSLFRDGVLLVCSSTLLSSEDLDKVGDEIMKALGR